MGKPVTFAIVCAFLVIAVSCAVLVSFSGTVPRESQMARISALFPCPKDGILPALPNPNFPPPHPVPLEPEPDPLDVGDLPMPELPPPVPAPQFPPAGEPELATPPSGGIWQNIWGWYREWLESLKIQAAPETVIRPRRR